MLTSDQQDIINLLRQQVLAEQDKAAELKRQNDLAAESLRKLEQQRQVELRRQRLWLDISEKTANLVQQLPTIQLLLHGFSEQLREYGEQLEDIGSRLDRIEYAIMLLLSGKGEGIRAQQLIKDIERDRQRQLVERKRTRLYELQMQAATYGIDVPAHIKIEIEDLRGELSQ